MNKPTLFKNITVVTPDENNVVTIPNCNVVVNNGLFQYIGPDYNIAKSFLSGLNYDEYNGKDRLLLPAFANSHTHLAMTLMRNNADDTTLHKWLFESIFPLEAKLRPQDLNSGTILGIAEMIKNGIGACANMYMTHDEAMDAQAAIDTGIRMNACINGGSFDSYLGRYVIDDTAFDKTFNKFNNAGDGAIKCSVLVHSIYLYDEEYYYGLSELAKSRNAFIHVHVSETQKEIDDCVSKYGVRPPVILEKMGIFSVPSIAAHCVFLNDEDREILRRNNVTVVHNPTSNLKLGSGIADIKKLFDAGINVALGTDGPASNNSLDMYQEMRLASFLAKGTSYDASVVPASQIVRAATVNGMKGLGFTNSGMIKVGMAADLQVLRTDNPTMTPLGNPISAIVYSANGNCVDSLMVNGKMLMKNRELLTMDEEKIMFDAKASSDYLYGN